MGIKNKEIEFEIEGQHNSIRLKKPHEGGMHNPHPKAQWFANAGMGMFIHWGISAVDAGFDLSWGMITGWEFAKVELTQKEIQQMMAKKQYRRSGREITPNEYFKLAQGFKAENYNADEWIRLAKDAGFTYAVLTARHHDGFALWPSKYGVFSTKNYIGGRDLVREYVDACRKYGLRVGLYYSPPDWYFNREYMSYIIYTARRKNPDLPELDVNYDPVNLPTGEVMEEQNKKYGEYVHGQLDELLTQYGKIDLLWFDGSMPHGQIYPMERIRELQPGIVVNPRMHGDGDFETCEVKEAQSMPKGWWEYCKPWPEKGWAYMNDIPYRPLSEITTELAKVRAWGGNYLLDIGPMSDGAFPDEAVTKLSELTRWVKQNGEAVFGTHPLKESESANVPATSSGNLRYLLVLPDFDGQPIFCGSSFASEARIIDTGEKIGFKSDDGKIIFNCIPPADDGGVRVIRITL